MGDKCDYFHVRTCPFWRKGTCNQGKKCMWLHREWKDNLELSKAAAAAAAQVEQPAGAQPASGTPKEKAKAKRRGSPKSGLPKSEMAVYIPPRLGKHSSLQAEGSTEEGRGSSRSALQSGQAQPRSATTTGKEDNSLCHGKAGESRSKGLGLGHESAVCQKVSPGIFTSYTMQIVSPGGNSKKDSTVVTLKLLPEYYHYYISADSTMDAHRDNGNGIGKRIPDIEAYM